jgi:protein-S-isoprenylcysteine O-methyltransferase Ste14
MGTALGVSVILVAVVLFALCIREFQAAGTPVQPGRPTTVIIKTGPYRFSRNPVYLSLTLFQIGIGIWVNSVWILGMVVPTLVLMSYGVIAREERYLERKFGREYLQYKSSVRRWL